MFFECSLNERVTRELQWVHIERNLKCAKRVALKLWYDRTVQQNLLCVFLSAWAEVKNKTI